jgi:tRNA(Ile)-lysidine synthetase-like protein
VSKRRVSVTTAVKQKVPQGGRVLVAFSGGRDSAVLLHALVQVQKLLSLTIEVCHVNHRLRPQSDDDEGFVCQQAEEYGLMYHVVRLPDRPSGENLEAWARRLRYEAFGRIMREYGMDTLVTAHTADDAAETLLMRLIANKELTSIDEFDPRRRCVRPLLAVSRAQIDEYVEHHRVPFVEDATNQDTSFVRNRVRHELMPHLRERFDPSISWILADRARSLALDCEALHQVAVSTTERIGDVQFSCLEWLVRCRSMLQEVSPAVQWRVVQCLFTPVLGHTLGELKCTAILDLINKGDSRLDLGADCILVAATTGLELIHTGSRI